MAQMDFGRNTSGNAGEKRGMSLLDLDRRSNELLYLSDLQYLTARSGSTWQKS